MFASGPTAPEFRPARAAPVFLLPFLSPPEEEKMARPARPLAITAPTVHALREEFLASCKAKNLSDRTLVVRGEEPAMDRC